MAHMRFLFPLFFTPLLPAWFLGIFNLHSLIKTYQITKGVISFLPF
jgi:hypothetical protein